MTVGCLLIPVVPHCKLLLPVNSEWSFKDHISNVDMHWLLETEYCKYYSQGIIGLFPLASEAHCRYTSLHKYVINFFLFYENSKKGYLALILSINFTSFCN